MSDSLLRGLSLKFKLSNHEGGGEFEKTRKISQRRREATQYKQDAKADASSEKEGLQLISARAVTNMVTARFAFYVKNGGDGEIGRAHV